MLQIFVTGLNAQFQIFYFSVGGLVSLGENCLIPGTIQHEIFHSFGVGHENDRYDRDDWVNIQWENVDPNNCGVKTFQKVDFEKWVDMETPYDLVSIMHYSGYSCSIKPLNDDYPTISYKTGDRKGQLVKGKRTIDSFGMTSMDVYQLCKLMECEKCAGIDIPTYQGQAHEHYMYKCENPYVEPPQFYWPRRCNDGYPECRFGDDENNNTCEKIKSTSSPPTTSKLILFFKF